MPKRSLSAANSAWARAAAAVSGRARRTAASMVFFGVCVASMNSKTFTWCAELRADLLVAAGRRDDERGAGADAAEERLVGGRIAGVEREEDIGGGHDGIDDAAGGEAEAFAVGGERGGVAELDEIGPGLDAGDLGAAAKRAGEGVPGGEGEVALAGSHVEHAHGLASGEPGLLAEREEQLHVAVDLAELVRGVGEDTTVGASETEAAQPGRIGRGDLAVLDAVVGGGGGGRGVDAAVGEAGFTFLVEFELPDLGRGVEVGGVEGVAETQFEDLEDRGRIGGFGEVALALAEMELEALAAGCDDALGGNLDEQLAGTRFAEHEAGEGAVGEGGAEVLEEFGARVGGGHREEVNASRGRWQRASRANRTAANCALVNGRGSWQSSRRSLFRGHSTSVVCELPKLERWVRFPLPAPSRRAGLRRRRPVDGGTGATRRR